MPFNKPIRVLSERIMSRGFEPTVGRLMENVQKVVRRQPGLLSLETLSDVNDHHKYVVLSEVRIAQLGTREHSCVCVRVMRT